MKYYIASCVFSSKFPELSRKVQRYVTERWHLKVIRCCTKNYKLKEFTDKMPSSLRDEWSDLDDSMYFEQGDTVYSICHNCSNIIEEMYPNVIVKSIWELILEDEEFVYPNRSEIKAVVQDCWRARERRDEQDAVRTILRKIFVDYIEAPVNRSKVDFCGSSLYREQPPRNPILAPKHYVVAAEGKFISYERNQQIKFMQDYCKSLSRDIVICYCHYCYEGLNEGGKQGIHLAELLF